MEEFEGQVALVTGGASGIGKATWQRLIAEGACVVVTDIDEGSGVEATADDKRVNFIRHDVTVRDQWISVMDQVRATYGRLDILVNSAGVLREGTVEGTDYETWRKVLSVNLDGTFWGCQTALPLLRKAERVQL